MYIALLLFWKSDYIITAYELVKYCIGMFYHNPDKSEKIEFSGDLNNFVSAHKYELFSPNKEVLDLIVNSMVPEENRFPIGKVRLTECRFTGKPQLEVDVKVSTRDFLGTRTALFGKTRLGKSNE